MGDESEGDRLGNQGKCDSKTGKGVVFDAAEFCSRDLEHGVLRLRVEKRDTLAY